MTNADNRIFTIVRVDRSDPGRPKETPVERIPGERNAESEVEQLRQRLTQEEINKGINYRVQR